MPLVWLDLETTGLDPGTGHILEVAVVVTDEDLEPIYSRSLLVDPRPDLEEKYGPMREPFAWPDVFAAANPTATAAADVERMHTDSGLLQAIDDLKPGNIEMAQEVLLGEVAPCFGDAPDFGPLCGNGVAHFDRAWLVGHMPEFNGRLSYRHLDTRSLWLATQRWADFGGAPQDARTHRAMSDVVDALQFARWFRGRFMTPLPDDVVRSSGLQAELTQPYKLGVHRYRSDSLAEELLAHGRASTAAAEADPFID